MPSYNLTNTNIEFRNGAISYSDGFAIFTCEIYEEDGDALSEGQYNGIITATQNDSVMTLTQSGGDYSANTLKVLATTTWTEVTMTWDVTKDLRTKGANPDQPVEFHIGDTDTAGTATGTDDTILNTSIDAPTFKSEASSDKGSGILSYSFDVFVGDDEDCNTAGDLVLQFNKEGTWTTIPEGGTNYGDYVSGKAPSDYPLAGDDAWHTVDLQWKAWDNDNWSLIDRDISTRCSLTNTY